MQQTSPVQPHRQDESLPEAREVAQGIWKITLPIPFPLRTVNVHALVLNDGFTQVDPEVMRNIIRVPPHDVITQVEDGEVIDLVGERYSVIWTPGHSDGHICLFRERDGVFLAADHVLPRITPNIGLYSERDRVNPLGDYMDSLRKVSTLPASIVLPGHGEPFKDLAGRVAEIIEHHEERESQIMNLLDEKPQNAYQLAEKLFGQRLKSNESRRMAVAATPPQL